MSRPRIPRRPPNGLIVIAVVTVVVMLNVAFDETIFEQLGSTVGALVAVAGSIYLAACLYWMERSR